MFGKCCGKNENVGDVLGICLKKKMKHVGKNIKINTIRGNSEKSREITGNNFQFFVEKSKLSIKNQKNHKNTNNPETSGSKLF